MVLVFSAIIGFTTGLLIAQFIFKDKPVGSLRIDQSDPDGGPYLFLELNRDSAETIYKKRYVRMRVKVENYISQK